MRDGSRRLEVDEVANLDAKRVGKLAEHVEANAHRAVFHLPKVCVGRACHLREPAHSESGALPLHLDVVSQALTTRLSIHSMSVNG